MANHIPELSQAISWIARHKRIWRASLLAFLLLAAAGPWTFDKIFVPAEYACSNAVRLEGDFCGIPLPGITIFFWGTIGFIESAIGLATGESALGQGIQNLLISLLLLALFLPIFSLLRLALRGNGRLWFLRAAIFLAFVLGLLFAGSGATRLHPAVWGIWLYLGLLALILVLEFFTLRGERNRVPGPS